MKRTIKEKSQVLPRTSHNSGITLVALIITIIVLLILAVVAIREVTGDGIIAHAKNAANSYEEAQRTEQSMLDDYLSQIEAGIYPTPTDQKYFSFTLDEATKTATVTGLSGECAYSPNSLYYTAIQVEEGNYITDIVIPRKYVDTDGTEYTVTAIGTDAFQIWRDWDVSFTSFVIPDTVTSIGDNAFSYCTKLTSITIPSSVTSIGSGAFSYCGSLTNITMPSSVTSIGSGAFYDCSSLTNITIPSSVTSIGSGAFSSCSSLKNIEVDKNNQQYSSENGIVFNKDKSALIQYPSAKEEKEYTIPSSVTSIGSGAFSSCSSLTNITIPSSVTSIGSGAFYSCSSLTNIYCEAESKPSGWNSSWNSNCTATVYWKGQW